MFKAVILNRRVELSVQLLPMFYAEAFVEDLGSCYCFEEYDFRLVNLMLRIVVVLTIG